MKEKEREKERASVVKAMLRVVVTSPDGKVLSDTGEKESKSYVIQFLEFFYGLFYATVNVNATATDGAERNIYTLTAMLNLHFIYNYGVGQDIGGIQVGTGDTPVTNDDWKLATKIAHGSGAQQLMYGAMVIGTVAIVAGNVDLETKRTFTNSSGATITVKECGAVVVLNVSPQCHMIIRDVLGTPVPVPHNCSVTIYYTFRTTV